MVDDFLLDGEGDTTIVRLLCSGVPEHCGMESALPKVRVSTERAMARLKVLVEQRERMASGRKEYDMTQVRIARRHCGAGSVAGSLCW